MPTIDPAKKAKLQAIQEQLLEVYLDEANPENWLTEDKAREQAQAHPCKRTEKLLEGWKGERYWEKKNAAQTMTMLIQIDRYLSSGVKADDDEDDSSDEKRIAKEMKAFEKEAKKRLARSRPQLVINNK